MIFLNKLPRIILFLTALIFSGFSSLAYASETGNTVDEVKVGLKTIDFLIIGLYMLSMLFIGWFYSRKNKTTEDYMLGGRSMKSWKVGLSLFATLLSAISFLAVPGEIIQHGPVLLCAMLASPLVILCVGYWLIPYFMKLKVTSAYEILETNNGVSVRVMGSLIFLITRIVWMALIVYLTASKIIIPIMHWPMSYAPMVCAIVGILTVIYTSMGGIRAVVLTDVIQTIILIFAVLLTILVVSVKMDGVSPWWPTQWVSTWDKQPIFSLDPHVRITVMWAIISEFCWWISTAGSDQMAIQRYLATRDVKAARATFTISIVVGVFVMLLLGVLGLALLGFFTQNQDILFHAGISMSENGDQLFPFFIVNILPPGVSGLIISGLLAASMSSLSSGVNSACTVISVDFLGRFRKPEVSSERKRVLEAKIVAFTVGLLVVMMSVVMNKVPGNILEVTNKTNGLFVGPLFGLFFMSLFVSFSTPFGTIWGAIYGAAAAAIIAYWDLLTDSGGLSWQWIVPISLIVNLIMGTILSLVPTRNKDSKILFIYSVGAFIPIMIILLVIK